MSLWKNASFALGKGARQPNFRGVGQQFVAMLSLKEFFNENNGRNSFAHGFMD
jgi:hypothetical protein